MSKCTDFTEQKTDAEQLCDELSCTIPNTCSIIFTPKFHCKIAGEGIKYSWGVTKKTYRRIPLHEKIDFQL